MRTISIILTNLFIIYFSVILKGQSPFKKDLLSKTWISVEKTEHIPMLNSHITTSIIKNESDSIIIDKHLAFTRYTKEGSFNGFCTFNSDSTGLSIIPLESFVGHVRPDLKEVYIEELTESTLIISYHDGKEGESKVIKYRLASIH